MSTDKHNIFESSESLSEKEIKDYLDGNLSPEEMQGIEEKMQNSSFEMDAMEGFTENPNAIHSMAKLKSQFTPKKAPFWNFKTLSVAASIAGIAVISSILLFDSPKQNDALITEVIEKKAEPKAKKSPEIIEIEEAEVIHDSNQIKSEEVIQNTPITLYLEESDAIEEEEISEAFAESFQLEQIPAKAVKVSVPEEEIVKSNAKTLYLNNFLVVDYSDTYNNAQDDILNESDFELSGTPAKYKSLNDTVYDDNSTTLESKTEQIDYTDYLSLTLSKYKNNNYKSALKNFKLIIDQYPNDVNAHFYGGLCYYNIDNPLKAIEFFDFILNQNINTFHQEAQYYKAMCMIRLGKGDQALFIFQNIANQGGFFAKKAQEMLDKSK